MIESLSAAAVLLLLAVGAVQDVQMGRISVMLNRLLLASIAVAVLALPFRGEPAALTAVRLGMCAAVLLLFLFYIIGGADAKFFMLTFLALPFRHPFAPALFLLITVVVWAVMPTREGLRMLDVRLLVPLMLLVLVDLRVAAAAVALYLAHIRYIEGSLLREKFPVLPALLLTSVLQLVLGSYLQEVLG